MGSDYILKIEATLYNKDGEVLKTKTENFNLDSNVSSDGFPYDCLSVEIEVLKEADSDPNITFNELPYYPF
jgi:hypothetical protein